MTCPSDAQLRTHVDRPDDEIGAHVTACDACAHRMADVTTTARLAARSIASLGVDADRTGAVDVDAALRAVAPGLEPAVNPNPRRLPIAIAAGIVTVAVVAALVITPTGRQAAASFLASFRAERIQPITFDPDQPLGALDGLADIADVEHDRPDAGEHREVDDLTAASEVSGFAATPVSSLPDGATLDGVVASPPSTVRLTFRGDRAPELPPALDGAQLVVSVPGTVGSTYEVDGQLLVVAEAGQLSVDAVGADLGQLREYLLNRSEVPDDLARQLLAIDDWTTTLPIPVPVDEIVWQDTTVAGQPGLMLSDTMGSGLLWQDGGRIHAIGAEGLDIDILHQVADGLG